MNFPKMMKVRQQLCDDIVKDIPAKIAEELAGIGIKHKIKNGDTVAITAGSRGIRNIDLIVKGVVDEVKKIGGCPFVVPAMGSHGGATAHGQKELLAHYGVCEAYIGAPVKATMEVAEIGRTGDGFNVYMDKHAYEADHIIVLNRIKPHTDFKGEIESGLLKMMTIGLGKHKGAAYYHKAAVKFGMEYLIKTIGQTVLNTAPILCGIGILENGYDETAEIKALKPENMLREEKALLKKAKKNIAGLPFDDADILMIDMVGKNISGTGMDTNVVGRFYTPLYCKEPDKPKIKRILVSDLTPEAGGNALGIGIADFCNQRIVDKMDRHATYINALTGMGVEKVRIPIAYPTDREMLETALSTIGLVPPEEARVIHIYSTLHLEYMELSQSYAEEIRLREDLEIVQGPRDICFDARGYFMPVSQSSDG